MLMIKVLVLKKIAFIKVYYLDLIFIYILANKHQELAYQIEFIIESKMHCRWEREWGEVILPEMH